MTDLADVAPDAETPVNPYSLLEAVNRSSDTAHMAWLVFLGIMTYLMIAVAGVTHRDLLLETPVSLPILQVDIQLTQFFQFAPIVLVLFHLGLISQLVLLARKTLEFDRAIRLLEVSDRRTHPLRLELHNFFFVQSMGGPHSSAVMGAILHAMSWLTLVVLPVVLILYIQVMFLPYHSIWITWTHRIALMFDIGLLILIGVFLMRVETSFFQAFWRTTMSYPMSFLSTLVVLSLVTLFSFFVATVPGEMLDRVARVAIGKSIPGGKSAGNEYQSGFVIPYFVASSDGSLFGIFRRNLVVTDTDLVVDRDVSKDERTLNLRGRDLRYAKLDRSDMHQADLTGANLDRSSLKGTDLRKVGMQCADISELRLTTDRVAAQCTSARHADFKGAILVGGDLSGIDARGAKFEEAVMRGAQLSDAVLTGADFSSADLRMANFSGSQAKGANFLIASLHGANLEGTKLFGADFRSAILVGATLKHAHLEGAALQGAVFDGASLSRAFLRGADFSGATIKGADLRGAGVWLTELPERDPNNLADFEGLLVSPPTKQDLTGLKEEIVEESGHDLGAQFAEVFAPLFAPVDEDWIYSDTGREWEALRNNRAVAGVASPTPTRVATATVGGGDNNDTSSAPAAEIVSPGSSFRDRLTEYLAKLVCRAQWADGSVATGVVRRALQPPSFRGDLVEIGQRLSSSSCPASKAMSPEVMQELSAATDRLQAR